MAGFFLDTNVLSEFARALPADPRVDAWLKATPDEFLFASVLTFAEIRRGLELLPVGKRRTHLEEWHADLEIAFQPRLLPVTKAIGDRWAILSAQAQRRGTPLAMIDGLIAATALEYDLTVVTRNGKDFAGLGIVLFNPWES
ncbi:MAG: type II toxin-antitoxin system VapC family toxin [Acidobacteria bacterium]|nr:type II toxin-antitoxin system VapC family toxin [Acidobacteriota bacterium]